MAIKIQLKLLGLHDIQQRLLEVRTGDAAQRTAARVVFRQASRIMAVSQRLCPVKFGNLRATGHVRIPSFRGPSRVDCEFGYGGPAAPYAVYVHENLNAHHPNGVAKFLEIPYLQFISGGLADFASEMRAAAVFGRSQRIR